MPRPAGAKVKITLPSQSKFLARGVEIPGSVWKQAAFPFSPTDFVPTGCSKLTEKPILASVQEDSLQRFIDNPRTPVTYGVGSAPADNVAKYFAAYLVSWYLEYVEGYTVVWETLNTMLSPNSQLRTRSPTLMVITNVFDGTSPVRMEKLRDLLEEYDNIPKIVVTAGIDPFSMITGKLGYRLDSLFFRAASSFKRIEVV